MAQNDIQTLTLYGNPTGGTFTLDLDGQSTSGIAFSATAGDVQTALEALSNIGSGNVSCTGGPLPSSSVTIEFQGTLASTNVSQLTADPSSLTGVTVYASITETTKGVSAIGSGLKAYWGCNETGASFTDSHTNSIDINRVGSVNAGSTTGVISTCRTFGSTTSQYRSDTGTSAVEDLVDIDSGVTVSGWFYTTSVSGLGNRIILLGRGANSVGSVNSVFYLYVSADQAKFSVINSSQAVKTVTSSLSLSASAWYHLVGVYDSSSSELRIYVSGTQYGTTTSVNNYAVTAGDSYITIGSNPPAGTFYVDELAVYGRVLSASEITYLYNSGSGRNYSDSSSSSGTDEVQTLSLSGSPAAGTILVGYDSEYATLAYNSSAPAAQTAMQALSTIGSGNMTCGGGDLPGTDITFTFTSALGSLDVDLLTLDHFGLWYQIQTTQEGAPTPSQASATWSSSELTPDILTGTATWSAGSVTATGNLDYATSTWTSSSLQAPGIPDSTLPTATWSSDVVHSAAPAQASVTWSAGSVIIPGVIADPAQANWKVLQFAVLPDYPVFSFWRTGSVTTSYGPLNVPTATWSSSNAIPAPALDGVSSATWSTSELTVNLSLGLPTATWSCASGALSPVLTTATAQWMARTYVYYPLIADPAYASWVSFRLIDANLTTVTHTSESVSVPAITGALLSFAVFSGETLTTPSLVSESLES